jgi:hypothetical protein
MLPCAPKQTVTTKNIRDLHRSMNVFEKSWQARSDMLEDENGDLLADS